MHIQCYGTTLAAYWTRRVATYFRAIANLPDIWDGHFWFIAAHVARRATFAFGVPAAASTTSHPSGNLKVGPCAELRFL
jgi:hypothetical protein